MDGDPVRDVLDPQARPRLRGVLHAWAFAASLPAGAILVATAPGGTARLAAAVYALSLAALFGTSALYHRTTWRSPVTRRRMRRLDHSMIFGLIAGTYTPFALLVLHGTLATAILVAVWGGALAGVILKVVWIDAPNWLVAVTYVVLGWVAVAATPELAAELGPVALGLLAAGGVLYTLGAVAYALHWPNPVPSIFGYHEVFHALVIVAAGAHFAVVAHYVLPAGA